MFYRVAPLIPLLFLFWESVGFCTQNPPSPDISSTAAKETGTADRPLKRLFYELSGVSPIMPIALSPDGTRLVYATNNGLFSLSFDGSPAELIAGTKGETGQPFFSPDGRWIGYWAGQELRQIPAIGGTPIKLHRLSGNLFGICSHWSEDNSIWFCQNGRGASSGVLRISANGGAPQKLFEDKSAKIMFPQLLPGGKVLLYTAPILVGLNQGLSYSARSPMIMVRSLDSMERKFIIEGSDGRYLPTGHIVFKKMNADGLFVIAFDAEKLEAGGKPVALVGGKITDYAVSGAGVIAYMNYIPRANIQEVHVLLNCFDELKKRVPVE
jgi:hypothetical protein